MSDASSEQDIMKKALSELKRLRKKVKALESKANEPVAVVGMACRFPGGADTPDAFYDLLKAGREGICEIPPDRWDVDAFYDESPFCPDKMYVKQGGFLRDIETFDAEKFDISLREARTMDPQQKVLLEVCHQALLDAGLKPRSGATASTGVFIGAISHDNFQQFVSHPELIDSRTCTGNSNSVLAGRLSYCFGFQGPCMAMDTSCSSSLVALHQACRSLNMHECEVAIAGGVNLILDPTTTIALCSAHMLSSDGRCRTFDAAANGYGRGEGCGVVVLKRLSDAVEAGDAISAVICGSAMNHNGGGSGLTVPSVLAQVQVIKQALSCAGVDAEAVSYVETHGTGTALGDPLEVEALSHAYGRMGIDSPGLVIGSVKTNVGHLEAAAGVASFIKTVLMLKYGEIFPHLNVETFNPNIPWDDIGVNVVREGQVWDGVDGERIAGISSFGFSGTNVHVIVKEA